MRRWLFALFLIGFAILFIETEFGDGVIIQRSVYAAMDGLFWTLETVLDWLARATDL